MPNSTSLSDGRDLFVFKQHVFVVREIQAAFTLRQRNHLETELYFFG